MEPIASLLNLLGRAEAPVEKAAPQPAGGLAAELWLALHGLTNDDDGGHGIKQPLFRQQ